MKLLRRYHVHIECQNAKMPKFMCNSHFTLQLNYNVPIYLNCTDIGIAQLSLFMQ